MGATVVTRGVPQVALAGLAAVVTGLAGLPLLILVLLGPTGGGSAPSELPGIPSEYHDLIFRKFGQVEMPRSPRTRSSGLGLTFCKLVVERHGGRIWVKGAEGKGSSFYIELPSDPTAVENQSVTASTASAWGGTGR